MRCSIVLFLIIATASANFQSQIILKLINDCSRTDWQSCLKIKMLTHLDKFRNERMISLSDGLTLINEKYTDEDLTEPIFSEETLVENLPRNILDRNQVLNALLFDQFTTFAEKYTLRWRMPVLHDQGKFFLEVCGGIFLVFV